MAPDTNIERDLGFNGPPLEVGHLHRPKERRGKKCVVRVTEHSSVRDADDVIRANISRRRRGPEVLEVSAGQLRRFESQSDLFTGLEASAMEAGMSVLRIRGVESADASDLLKRGYVPLEADVSLWEKPLTGTDTVDGISVDSDSQEAA